MTRRVLNTYVSAHRIAPAARGAARVAWLRLHGAHLPGAFGDITPAQRDALEAAGAQMIREGLWNPTYQRRMVRWGIRLILSADRGDQRPDYEDRAQQRYRS